MCAFVRNNIRYRSATSKALEGYYNSKAFILNELISSKNGFSETAKEILLLLFNKNADWLAFVEPLLLDKKSVSDDDVSEMKNSLNSVQEEIDQIFKDHPEVFETEFVRHWQHIHEQTRHTMYDAINTAKGMPQIIAFPFATECLVEYLNTTLFELYELDCLLGSDIVKEQASTNHTQPDKLIMFIDDATLRYKNLTGIQPEVARFSYYVDELIDVNRSFSVEIRDYSRSGSRADVESERNTTCMELQEYFGKLEYVREMHIVQPNS